MSYIRDKLKDRGLSRCELFEISNEMEEMIGQRELLDSIQLALDTDTLREVLEYTTKNFDL